MKNKITIYKIAAGLVVFLFFYILLDKVIPQYYSVWQVAADYSQASAQLDDEQNWQEETVQLKRRITSLTGKIKETNLELPESGMLSRPLQVLDSLADKNKIKIREIQTIAADSSKLYDFITIQLLMEGTFKNSSNFIKQIEAADIVINVRGLDLKLASLFRQTIQSELKLVLVFKRTGQ